MTEIETPSQNLDAHLLENDFPNPAKTLLKIALEAWCFDQNWQAKAGPLGS